MSWLKQRRAGKHLDWFAKKGFSHEAAVDFRDTMQRRRVVKAYKIGSWCRAPQNQRLWLKSVGKRLDAGQKIIAWYFHCDDIGRKFAILKFVYIVDKKGGAL
jgi:hypothetical protein